MVHFRKNTKILEDIYENIPDTVRARPKFGEILEEKNEIFPRILLNIFLLFFNSWRISLNYNFTRSVFGLSFENPASVFGPSRPSCVKVILTHNPEIVFD